MVGTIYPTVVGVVVVEWLDKYIVLWSQLSPSDKMIIIAFLILGLFIWGQGIVAILDQRKINKLTRENKTLKSRVSPESESK